MPTKQPPGRMFLCSHTLRLLIGPARARKPARTALETSEANRAKSALAKAKRLATKHGVDVERDRQGGYWVTYAPLADKPEDPLNGEHFCSDGIEALQAVEAYVEFLAAS